MTALALVLALTALLATIWMAVAAKSLRNFSRHELEVILRERRSEPILGDILLWHERMALVAECLEVLCALTFVAAADVWIDLRCGGRLPWGGRLALAAVLAAALIAVMVWIPRALARIGAAWFVFRTWRFWRFLGRALFPLTAGAALVDWLAQAVTGRRPQEPDEESLQAEIRTIVSEAHREGIIEEEAREMIEGVMLLRNVHVAEVMVPRIDMVCLPIATPRDEALRFTASSGHSRIPLYDKSRDDVVGILHLRDLLAETVERDAGGGLAAVARPPLFVPETKPLDELLREFRDQRQHMAVVLDEYGGVSGLVTMEDVLEEIVGEIADETDTEHDAADGIRIVDEQTTDVAARVHIDELNERLGLNLPDDRDFDTIGGLVFAELGRLPRVGETLILGNVRITVTEASRRRVERVRLEIVEEPHNEPAA